MGSLLASLPNLLCREDSQSCVGPVVAGEVRNRVWDAAAEAGLHSFGWARAGTAGKYRGCLWDTAAEAGMDIQVRPDAAREGTDLPVHARSDAVAAWLGEEDQHEGADIPFVGMAAVGLGHHSLPVLVVVDMGEG